MYGEEDTLWDNLVHEQVSCSHIIFGVLLDKIISLETNRYAIESLVHRKFVRTGSSDAGHEVSIFYPSFFDCSYKHKLRYNIEPFFWSSSLNWIASRFQEEIKDKVGDREFCSEVLDHWILIFQLLIDITITLTFLHSLSNRDAIQLEANQSTDFHEASTLSSSQKIDTRSPLVLYSSLFFFSSYLFFFSFWLLIVDKHLLVLDLLSVHFVRDINGSTIISYHPTLNITTTTARFLYERIRFAGTSKLIINFHSLIQLSGQSVYWQSMFQKSHDPSLVLLTFIWHAMYAWDEALEDLYEHICFLVSRVIFVNLD